MVKVKILFTRTIYRYKFFSTSTVNLFSKGHYFSRIIYCNSYL